MLAASVGQEPRQHVQRAEDALAHCFNLTHDLEANGFFVDLAMASRGLPDQGLYHWVGEAEQRIQFRAGGRGRADQRQPASDGWGRYLTPAGPIIFELEMGPGQRVDEAAARQGSRLHAALWQSARR